MECHSFGVQLATKYGIAEALLLGYFRHYIELAEKKQNKNKFHDGRYWTYASTRELAKRFPYINRTKLLRAIQHLTDEELLTKDNFNKSTWDKTAWYSLTEKGLQEFGVVQNEPRVVQNEPRVVQNEPRVVQNEPRVVQNEPRVVQNEPRVVQNEPTIPIQSTYSIHLGSSGNKQTDNAEQVNEEANRYPGTKYDQETYSDAVSAYEKHIQTPLTANIVDEVCAMVDDWGLEAVKYGFKTAGRNGVRKLNYVETCARNYITNKDKPKKTRAQGKPKNDIAGTVEAALKLLGVSEDE